MALLGFPCLVPPIVALTLAGADLTTSTLGPPSLVAAPVRTTESTSATFVWHDAPLSWDE